MTTSLLQFGRALIPWIVFAVFDVIGAQYDFPVLGELSDHELRSFVCIVLLIGAFFAFHNLRKERDELAQKLDRRSEINAALQELSSLRSAGVALRNQGPRLGSAQVQAWKSQVEDWRANVVSELSNLSPAEVGLFDTLDTYQLVQVPGVTDPDVQDQMQMLLAETGRIAAAMLRWQTYIA
jgi:hypothetical protein